jgi:hypothetical protein
MRRHTEEQIIAILKEHEAGMNTADLNGNYYLPSTGETIPANMATPSPDDRFHHCIYYPVANDVEGYPVWGSEPKTRCFFAPMNSS